MTDETSTNPPQPESSGEDGAKSKTVLQRHVLRFSFDDSEFTEAVAEAEGPISWATFSDGQGRVVASIDLAFSSEREGEPPRAPECCSQCRMSIEPPRDRVSVRRQCLDCERDVFHWSEAGAQGPIVKVGEPIMFPAHLVTRSMRYVNGASFTRVGVDWLAREMFGLTAAPRLETMLAFMANWQVLADALLESEPLAFQDQPPTDEELRAFRAHVESTPESNLHAATIVSAKARSLAELLSGASDEQRRLARDVFLLGAAQSVLAFRFSSEEACLRANSVQRIRWLIDKTRNSLDESEEKFWQDLFLENSVALTQLFASPVIIHGDEFFVGGASSGGGRGRISDFVLRGAATNSPLIIEIKTPTTPLLAKTEYRRDLFAPSRALVGSVQQVIDQRDNLVRNLASLQGDLEDEVPKLEAVQPECMVIVGNASRELSTRSRRRAFENYRRELRTVRIVTFDEVVARWEGLVKLLSGASNEVPREREQP